MADVKMPLISCICPTYNRPPDYQHLIEEAVESFLRQTHPNKELIVLNDCRVQELVCDAPDVYVVKVPDRFPTLGEKRNAGVRMSRGQLIAPWDDDDISLPWRLSASVELLGDADYFNPRRCFLLDHKGLRVGSSAFVGHNLSLFTRAAFEAVGGYPAMNTGQDLALDQALSREVMCAGGQSTGRGELASSEWYYVYRWGVSPLHVSSRRPPDDAYRDLGTVPVQEGRFELTPHWRMDYEAETRRLLEESSTAEAACGITPGKRSRGD
jgi:hypothetical protein